AEDVHRAEHVVLRQPDADVEPADARAALVVDLVPRAGEERVHPGLEGDLQAADLALAALERLAGLVVLDDAPVEDVGDAHEILGGARVEGAKCGCVLRSPLDITFELFEESLDAGVHIWAAGEAGFVPSGAWHECCEAPGHGGTRSGPGGR